MLKSYKCRTCRQTFTNRRDLHRHRLKNHFQSGGKLHEMPWESLEEAPWVREDGTIDTSLQEEYEDNRGLILQENRVSDIFSVYNFPVSSSFTNNDVINFFEFILSEQEHSFKVNIAVSMILRHRETGRYRYFNAGPNVYQFDQPFLVHDNDSITNFKEKIMELTLESFTQKLKEDTKWDAVLVTNISFVVYGLNYVIGSKPVVLPDHI
ncbi:unnamed protein product, partial [Owenia fusiformis]